MATTRDGTHTPEDAPAPQADRATPWKRGLVAVGLTVLAVIVNGIFTLPALITLTGLKQFVAVMLLGEVAFLTTGVAFLLLTDRGIDYLDLSIPDGRTLAKFLLGGTIVLFTLRTSIVGTASVAGVPLAPPTLLESSGDPRSILLLLIPLSIIVVGPCEELLFRGVLQRYLRGAFSVRGSILGAGILFALIHVPTLVVVPSLLGIVVTISVIFLVGLGFGWIYVQTNSLPVAMGVHGLYNAMIGASAYLLLTFDVISM